MSGPRDPLSDAAGAVHAQLAERCAIRRLFEGDHTLWRDDPTEVADRLGWIPVIGEVLRDLGGLRARADRLVEGVDKVLVMGMGGSSLFPEVLARSFAPGSGRPELHVLDTTHPGAVARVASVCPPERTLHIASSKSGSTIETLSHLEWAWERGRGSGRFAVITDPGSELGDLARARGFAEVFENRPDIGGRYSALSMFGVVPALLAGVDVEALLRGGLDGLGSCGPHADPDTNPALRLAAAMVAGVESGRDKLTFTLAGGAVALGPWLEQLVAESLGKDGTGVVPVVDEEPGSPASYGRDRVFVLDPRDGDRGTALRGAGHPVVAFPAGEGPAAIGRAVVVAEIAVALAGAALGVQPFDQPDVAAAKAATSMVLETGELPVVRTDPVEGVLGRLELGDHLALQAFVDPGGPAAASLRRVRTVLRDRHRVAVTLGFGPRFLHSTGQLHKGGPSSIVCLQVLDQDGPEMAIPGRAFGFGHLLAAQAAGDLRALVERGRRAGRVDLSELVGHAS